MGESVVLILALVAHGGGKTVGEDKGKLVFDPLAGKLKQLNEEIYGLRSCPRQSEPFMDGSCVTMFWFQKVRLCGTREDKVGKGVKRRAGRWVSVVSYDLIIKYLRHPRSASY